MTLNTSTSYQSGAGATSTKPNAFYDKILLETRRQKTFYHDKLAQKRPMPKKSGDTINFRRFGKLSANTTPLVEGVTPDGKAASLTAISASTKQYGDYMLFTDLVDVTVVDDTLKHYTLELGYQANETLDILTRDTLLTGSVFRPAGKATDAALAADNKPTINDFRAIVLSMKMNHIAPALNGKYVAFVSPAVMQDLIEDPQVQRLMQFGNTNQPIMDSEIVDIHGIKFIEAINTKIDAGVGVAGVNVHSSVVLGKEAYGVTTIQGEGDITTIVKALGSSGTEDALNQRQSIGWKVNAFTAVLLDPLAAVRYPSVPTNN